MSEPWKRNLPVPYLSQREVKYIWYQLKKESDDREADGAGNPLPGVSLAWMSCNIVSLCMVLHYFGITDDTPDQMLGKFFEVFRPRWRQADGTVCGGR